MPWSARCAVVACGHTQALGDKTAEVHDHNPGAADVEASARGGPLDAGGCAQVADADALRARKKRTAAETAIMKSRLVAAPANPSNTGPQSVPAHSHTHTCVLPADTALRSRLRCVLRKASCQHGLFVRVGFVCKTCCEHGHTRQKAHVQAVYN